jgi:hypothetical protein
MKRLILIATLIALGSASVGSTSASAFDWSSRASFMSEWQQQMARIADGRRSGMLSKAEARMLRRELEAVGEMSPGSKACTMLSEHSKKIASYKSSG